MGRRPDLGLVPVIYLELLVIIVQLGRAVSSSPDLADMESGPWFQYNRATAEWERVVVWSTTPDPPALNKRAPLSVTAMRKELESVRMRAYLALP